MSSSPNLSGSLSVRQCLCLAFVIPLVCGSSARASLLDEAIEVIHRSHGSGMTFLWTGYLSKVSAEWKPDVGAGTTVKWPVGQGAEHNNGVALAVRTTHPIPSATWSLCTGWNMK